MLERLLARWILFEAHPARRYRSCPENPAYAFRAGTEQPLSVTRPVTSR
jgi:hypothetical protein